MRIKLDACYCCEWPTWVDGVPVDPHTLGLSVDLANALAAWGLEYDATLDQTYPPDSAFPSPEAEAAWRQRGKELAVRLARELGPAGQVEQNGRVVRA